MAECARCNKLTALLRRGLCKNCHKRHGAGYPQLRRSWTTGEIAKLRKLVADGYYDDVIAADLGRSQSSVAHMRHRFGILKYKVKHGRSG